MHIPGYEIEQELGHGAMATVYLAIQKNLDRKIALKVLAPGHISDSQISQRFLREAKIIAQLAHSNIITIYDVGCHGDCNYIAMEYHSGGDLKQKIKAGIEPFRAMAIIKQVAAALDFAHRAGYIHRDVKSGNILFDNNDNAILSDFGIARSREGMTQMTVAGSIMGTPQYMSPEQAKGAEVDYRTDIYSLGIIFFEMLTGAVPFTADEPIAICFKQISEPAPKLDASLSMFQPVIDKMLEKDPELRIQNAAAVIDAIERIEVRPGRNVPSLGLPPAMSNGTNGLDRPRPVPEPTQVQEDALVAEDLSAQTIDRPTWVRDPVGDGHPQSVTKKEWGNKPKYALGVMVVTVGVLLAAGIFMWTKIAPSSPSSQSSPNSEAKLPHSEAKVAVVAPKKSLLKSFDLITPKSQKLCNTNNPWLLGKQIIQSGTVLSKDSCFALFIEPWQQTQVFLLAQSQNGKVVRLVPNSCNAMGLNQSELIISEGISLPVGSDRTPPVIGLDNTPGREMFYVIAVTNQQAAEPVKQLISTIPDACESTVVKRMSVRELRKTLMDLELQYPHQLQWEVRSFQHEVG